VSTQKTTERIEMLHPDAARRLGVPVQEVRLVFSDDPVVANDCYAMDGKRLGGCISNMADA
jgi:hypothetical protein